MIKKKKKKITFQGSNWNKVKREKVYAVLLKPTQPFIFNVTMMVRMEGEMNFLTMKLYMYIYI